MAQLIIMTKLLILIRSMKKTCYLLSINRINLERKMRLTIFQNFQDSINFRNISKIIGLHHIKGVHKVSLQFKKITTK